MSCNQDPKALAAYLDGELSATQSAPVQQHISTCPRCAAEVASLVSLQRGLRNARAHFAPSDAFRQKMQQQIAAASKPAPSPRRSFFRLAPMSLALAAMLLLAVGVNQFAHRQDQQTGTYAEVADLHINALASSNPFDVISSDRHTVKPWFQGRIPFSFNVPEFAGTNFTLLGGRLVYLHQQPGAQLIVAVRQHKISVLIFQDAADAVHPISTSNGVANRNSFNIETFQSHNLRFFIIGDTEAADIEKLTQSLQQANP